MPRARKDAKEPKKVGERVRFWLAEIAASKKRDSDFHKEGKTIRDTYDGTKHEETPFNILYSNTDILLPALYSTVPRPVVQRRYKDDDPVGLAAAKAAQRMLEFQIDTNIEGYETFDETMTGVTLDGLLPGRGISTVKYDADIANDVKQSEMVCTELRSWDRVYFGYAKKWSKVPWVAYEEYIDKEEAERLFGKDIAGQIEYTTGEGDDEDGRKQQADTYLGERKTALIYQIWDKNGGKKIRYVSPHYTDDYLLEQDDPLNLTGFFNCPKPVTFVEKTNSLTPTALYTLYENQATELNLLTIRISRITSAIKARGLYTGDVSEDIENLMQADDNKLVPIEAAVGAAGEKALSNAIWFMPLDTLVKTLSELYAAREQCKQVIYEIMGISDILRGASKASETLGAQEIKSQWGSLRIKPKQYEVQRYCRDNLRMMVEIAATKFSQTTWAKMTGLPYLTDEQVMQGQQMMQALQQQLAQGQQMLTMQPQMAEQIGPQMQQGQQQLQMMQQKMQETPKWGEILAMLQDDLQRAYKIDVETNSTIEPELAEDQKNISDLMGAMSQFLNGVGPMVAEGIMPFEVAQTMLTAITRRFRFGDEIEDQIKQMKPPQPKDDGKAKAEQAAMQAQQQAAQKDMQAQQAVAQKDAENQALQLQLKQAQAENQFIAKKNELDLRELKVQTDEALLKLEKQAASESLQNKTSVENTKLDHRKAVTGMEAKQAKTEQVVSKTVDTKMGDAVKALGGMIEQLVTTVTQQAEGTQQLIAAVKAPRRKTAVRGKDGRISETVEEVLQ